jgi:MYXO-CTERM domain-containing protein
MNRATRAALSTAIVLSAAIEFSPGVAYCATFVVEVVDGPNDGFNDPGAPDAASSAGGNSGSTVGEQRLEAFQFAADVWGGLLESAVPVVIEASMEGLECSGGSAVLGAAGPSNFVMDSGGGVWFPSALADAINGEDQDPGRPDIEAFFNGSVDDSSCLGPTRWYYGLDGNPPEDGVDFLSVVLHELGHGLGFTSLIDFQSGQFLAGDPDVFSSMIYDTITGERWPDLSSSERGDSITRPRSLAWDGPAVTNAAPSVLAPGSPVVTATPDVDGFSGAINESDFGSTALQQSAEGRLVEVTNSCDVPNDLEGAVVLIRFTGCLGIDDAEDAGAVAALVSTGTTASPPGDFNLGNVPGVSIPTLHISDGDAQALSDALDAGLISIALSASSSLVGADSSGRVLLNATDPIQQGSSVAHWDALTRRTEGLDAFNRDLLMEPSSGTAGPGVDLTVHLLSDLGWDAAVCGDADLDSDEECDDGEANSDTAQDACRRDCTLPSCGDAVTDSSEDCDDGAENGQPDSICLDDCTLPPCGNGRPDAGEECDDGEANSDSVADACRTDCTLPACGDGVRDSAEACDDALANSDTLPDACRSTCRLPSCGDGVLDSTELCDNGANNSDLLPDACRTTCALPGCGDGVLDSAEPCDEGSNNSDTLPDGCRSACTLPACGDGVLDSGELCDNGANNSAAADACRSTCSLPACGDSILDSGEGCDDGNLTGGDGCSISCTLEGPVLIVPGASGGVPGAPTGQTFPTDPAAGTLASPNGSAVPGSVSGDLVMVQPSGAESDGGCGCRVPGKSGSTRSKPALLLVLGLLFAARRWPRPRDGAPRPRHSPG